MKALVAHNGGLLIKGGGLAAADDPCNCCNDCIPEFDSGMFDQNLERCQRINVIATVTNNFSRPALLSANGGADDEIIIDGEIYEPGKYPFDWGSVGGGCGSQNGDNGAHAWTFEKTLQPGESVTFGGKDNGFGGWVDGTWTLETCYSENPLP